MAPIEDEVEKLTIPSTNTPSITMPPIFVPPIFVPPISMPPNSISPNNMSTTATVSKAMTAKEVPSNDLSSDAPKADYIVPLCHEQVEVLYEDPLFLLVSKPSGLLSVPGKHPLNRDCLITRLQMDYPEARIVHRLDLDTSGIMVIALTANSHRNLSKQFEKRETYKSYTAMVFGQVEQTTGAIDLPLISDWPNRPKQMVDFEQGKQALTHYEVLERLHDRTRILLKPVTGRSHQLRVHTAEIQHPILGCKFYAHEEAIEMASRLLLHATELHINHPESGERIEGFCQVPF